MDRESIETLAAHRVAQAKRVVARPNWRSTWLFGSCRCFGVDIRSGQVIAIPESGNIARVRENAAALSLALTSEELQALDGARPPPRRWERPLNAGRFVSANVSELSVLIVKRCLPLS